MIIRIVGERVRISILWYRINQRVMKEPLFVRLICCLPQIVFEIKCWQDKCVCSGFLKFNRSECCSHSLWFHARDCATSPSIYRGLQMSKETPIWIDRRVQIWRGTMVGCNSSKQLQNGLPQAVENTTGSPWCPLLKYPGQAKRASLPLSTHGAHHRPTVTTRK